MRLTTAADCSLVDLGGGIDEPKERK